MTIKNTANIVLIFPDQKDRASLKALATEALDALKKVTGNIPVLIQPDTSVLCLLIEGEISSITKAIELNCGNEVRWFVAPLGGSAATFGLGAAHAWTQHRAR